MRSVWLSTVLCVAACGGAKGRVGRPEGAAAQGRFPTAEELARITAQPLSADALAIDEVEVDEWELAGPLADRVGAAPAVGRRIGAGCSTGR